MQGTNLASAIRGAAFVTQVANEVALPTYAFTELMQGVIMNTKVFAIAILSSGLIASAGAHAVGTATQCAGTALSNTGLVNTFGNKTVSFECQSNCDAWMNTTSPDWHETHNGSTTAGGSLYEVGSGTAMDPGKTVGTWHIDTTNNKICYSYTGDNTYCYTVYPGSNNDYEFCNAAGLKALGTVDGAAN